MRILVRPEHGRIAGGVASAFAERYDLNVLFVRLVFLTSLLASELSVLLYVMLWLAIPDEKAVAVRLRLAGTLSDTLAPRQRFDKLSSSLLDRLGVIGGRRESLWSITVAFTLLLVSIALQLARLDDTAFYINHPVLSKLSISLDRITSALFYTSLALLFIVPTHSTGTDVELAQRPKDEVDLDKGPTKAIYGLISGLSRTLRIDAGYLRVVAGLLNVLTLGLVGLVYLIGVAYLERKGKIVREEEPHAHSAPYRIFPQSIRLAMGLLLLLLAGIRLATEFRFFFFNEPFAMGLVLIIIGSIFTFRALKVLAESNRGRLWIIVGPMILLFGIYQLSIALFHVQLPFAARFQVTYLLLGTTFIYYSLLALKRHSRLIGVSFGILFYVFTLFIQFGLISSHFLLLLVQFYDFFYPIIFAGMGLWIVLDK